LNNTREFSLDINGLDIAIIEYGNSENPTLIALHGWLDNAASFALLAEQLPHYHIVAIDLVGHGHSSHRGVNQPYYIWDNVMDLYLILQALNIEKADLLGHSMGASVVMLFAACFAEKVDKLFMIEGLAPLSYPADKLPALMAEAIQDRAKFIAKADLTHTKDKKAQRIKSFELLVKARMNSIFSVTEQAAKLLVARGAKLVNESYQWRSDSALMLSSIQRMSEEQIIAFLKSLKADTYIYLGDDGLSNDKWQEYLNHIDCKQVKVLSGNHHLHMHPQGATLIAQDIDRVYT
jgi:pimeloyl-ACP methyl ester carboxylesterase